MDTSKKEKIIFLPFGNFTVNFKDIHIYELNCNLQVSRRI